ncbi:hypothetical protein N802_12065 [Knoellia sinensis KCTC 19936]|uniref:Mycothiol-dependent maleylpyruvate isomerase metal-binding domain-containing protein n=1 Tax=Knoellia sinensis KCTC 19936 TaxID=1385520 RepID=A0A0A0JDN0_9MICO|nr:TIGR03086 family metal-binding protein [Knoellia sinensis]KGN34132.1 hypothetical protein N802_12065 [Knoellia sinensis KCTC 19936]
MTDTAQRFRSRATQFASLVDAAASQADTPSPCEGWTVRDVVMHTIDTERDFLATRGLDVGERPDPTDVATAWRTHADTVAATLSSDGVAETEYAGYFGPTTIGETMADFYGWDLVIHGWDVARATGQDWRVSDEDVTWLNASADGWGDALRAQGICGPEVPVPADASPQDKLLGRLGRDPQWVP